MNVLSRAGARVLPEAAAQARLARAVSFHFSASLATEQAPRASERATAPLLPLTAGTPKPFDTPRAPSAAMRDRAPAKAELELAGAAPAGLRPGAPASDTAER